MPKVMKTCRVCGRSYEACRTINNVIGVFRWQEVACSPECGYVYLRKLDESRGVHTEKAYANLGERPAGELVAEPDAEPVIHPIRKKKTKDAENTGVVPLRLEAEEEDADTSQK